MEYITILLYALIFGMSIKIALNCSFVQERIVGILSRLTVENSLYNHQVVHIYVDM